MFSAVSNNKEQAQENRSLSLRISKTILAKKGKNNCCFKTQIDPIQSILSSE